MPTNKNTTLKLWFGDIIVLLICAEYVEAHNTPITQLKLYNPHTRQSVINDWLEQRQIDKIFCRTLTGNYALLESVKRLRACGLISAAGNFAPTNDGMALLAHPEITRDYLNWPIFVPFVDGQFVFAAAHRIDQL